MAKKLKCPVCDKNITLAESTYCLCKCGKTFCPTHRIGTTDNATNQNHKCDFDYINHERNKLVKSNPKIINNKIEII